MAVQDSLRDQLLALAGQAERARSSDVYGTSGMFGRTVSGTLANIVLEAQMLLAGKPRFLLLTHRLSTLASQAKPLALEISDLLKLAARTASEMDLEVSAPAARDHSKPPFVDPSRIRELTIAGPKGRFDVTRLVRLCEELNSSFAADNIMATAMLLRAIRDHCPPIFGQSSFAAVVSNASGLSRSTKELFDRFENSMTRVADAFLHERIRNREVLPTPAQVFFMQKLMHFW